MKTATTFRLRVLAATTAAIFSPPLVGVALGAWPFAQGGWVAVACSISVLIAAGATSKIAQQEALPEGDQ